MNINEVKDLMHEFDQSSLREFLWKNGTDDLEFSKNDGVKATSPVAPAPAALAVAAPVLDSAATASTSEEGSPAVATPAVSAAEGEAVPSPLVGVVYLKPAPDKAEFVKVGDTVKKGQTLLIIEAMKVMNEIPAPKDGVITEVLVSAEDVVEYGQELVRIK